MKNLFCFIGLFFTIACQETTINPTAVGTLRGNVISTLGEPVANARVEDLTRLFGGAQRQRRRVHHRRHQGR